MGRKRKNGDPLGLAGTRLQWKRNKFWYVHRSTAKWENFGTDIKAAKARAAQINDPQGEYGTVAYWFPLFLEHCQQRVNNKAATGKLKMSPRTLDDYRKQSVPLIKYFGRMLPEMIAPATVQGYLDKGAELGRPVPANRERACLSAMLSWLMRQPGFTTIVHNPCGRSAGVQRNTESKRERYVTDEEYRAVFAAAPQSVRIMMELCYRTLQRPESDIIFWTPTIIKHRDGARVLNFRQHKTGHEINIACVDQLDLLLKDAIDAVAPGAVVSLTYMRKPIIRNRSGEGYTYSGLSTMLKKAIAAVRAEHKANGGALAKMASFGFRDLKGKGATDMWRGGIPIEQIQLLCGHAKKETTEIYVKARWHQAAQPNRRAV
jgi:integrase